MRAHYIRLGFALLAFCFFCLLIYPVKGSGIASANEMVDPNVDNINHWVLCLERSQGMNTPLFFGLTRMDLAKIGADLFIELIHPSEHLSIVSYAQQAKLEFQISALSSGGRDTEKIKAQTAVDLIAPKGLAFLGEGLDASLRSLETKEDTSNESVVVISNLWSGYGTQPQDLLPDFIDRGTKLYTLGVGNRVDHGMLMELATQTGGNYSYIWNDIFLPASMACLYSEKRGGGELLRQFNIILSGETLFEDVMVDPYCEEVIFILYWMQRGSNLECLLIDPDGTRITPLSGIAPTNMYPYTEMHYISRHLFKLYKVKYPKQGLWQMKIISQEGLSQTPYVFEVIAENREESPVVLHLNTDKQVYYASSSADVIQLEAFLETQGPIVEDVITVEGTVNSIGGSSEMALYDDGLLEHNDQIASDGVYSNVFVPYSVCAEQEVLLCAASQGPFVFTLSARNFDPLALKAPEGGAGSIDVNAFQRNASITVLVEGGETNLPPVANAGQDQEITNNENKKGIPIQLNGLDSFDPEGEILDFAWFASGIEFDDPTSPQPTGFFPAGTTTVSLLVSDGVNISEPDTVTISIKNLINYQNYYSFYQSIPYNLFNHNQSQNPFFSPYSSTPLSLNNYKNNNNFIFPFLNRFSYPFGPYTSIPYTSSNTPNHSLMSSSNSFRSSDTVSYIIDSPYATAYVFGSGYSNCTINIVNNYYYTYNYYTD